MDGSAAIDPAAMAWVILAAAATAATVSALVSRAEAPHLPAIAKRKADEARGQWLVRDRMGMRRGEWVIRLESNDRERRPFDLALPEDHPDIMAFRALQPLDTIRLDMVEEPCCAIGQPDAGHYLRLATEAVVTWGAQRLAYPS